MSPSLRDYKGNLWLREPEQHVGLSRPLDMLLVIIIDIPSHHPASKVKEVYDAVRDFAKAYLMLSRGNDLRIYAASSQPIFTNKRRPNFKSSQNSISSVRGDGNINANYIDPDPTIIYASKTLIGEEWVRTAGDVNFHAIYDERLAFLSKSTEDADGVKYAAPIASALTKALCTIKRWNDINDARDSRIFVMQTSPDVESNYQHVQNCIFAACSLNVTIDCCILPIIESTSSSLSSSSSSASMPMASSVFLEQAAYRTKGILARVDHQTKLQQHIMMSFLPSITDRAVLRVPTTPSFNLSANCFCHNQPVKETAWVCSVCLSIFCEPPAGNPAACPACQTEVAP